jgi:ribosomal protein L35AE/L33A
MGFFGAFLFHLFIYLFPASQHRGPEVKFTYVADSDLDAALAGNDYLSQATVKQKTSLAQIAFISALTYLLMTALIACAAAGGRFALNVYRGRIARGFGRNGRFRAAFDEDIVEESGLFGGSVRSRSAVRGGGIPGSDEELQVME